MEQESINSLKEKSYKKIEENNLQDERDRNSNSIVAPSDLTKNEIEYEDVTKKTTHGTFSEFIDGLLTGRSEDQDFLQNGEISMDLLQPISKQPVPENFFRKDLKPVHKVDFDSNVPIETNKFYANIFLGLQQFKIFSVPYSIKWIKDKNEIGVSGYGEPIFGTCMSRNCHPTFYINLQGPVDIGFGSSQVIEGQFNLEVLKMNDLFVEVKLSDPSSEGTITIPVAQGMGFVTAIFDKLKPKVITQKNFTSVRFISYNESQNLYKYQFDVLEGGKWIVYLSFEEKLNSEPDVIVETDVVTFNVTAERTVLQITKLHENSDEKYIDAGAGVYPTNVSVQASISRFSSDFATYSINYSTNKGLGERKPLVYAMRHHVQSMTYDTLKKSTPLFLPLPVKGYLRGFISDTLEMTEHLSTKNITTLPWFPFMKSEIVYNSDDLEVIRAHAERELKEIDFLFSDELRSFYYKGKALGKYANLLVVLHNILKDETMTKECLLKLKKAYQAHFDNVTTFKFFYDMTYKGITTTASELENNELADFGSSYYNDHQFFYGYFVYAAGVIGLVDKDLNGNWAEQNKDWVNSLVRDVANPSPSDVYFPVFRSFDWFNGHSWSKGLFESLDGKDEESTSEDYNFYYGMKIWASAIDDKVMENRADLILSVMKRALNNYVYYKKNNTIMFGEFAKNQVSGILFENKIDYTTYFGNPKDHPEYVHGIHVIPISAISSFFRDRDYVEELWNYQLMHFVDKAEMPWQILIRFNQVLFDPIAAYPEFLKFDHLEDKAFGISLAWCLAVAAAAKNAVQKK